ncbi:MAG: hypothetical protein NVSMB23_28840 [Myxococcales bacterium]
MDLRPRRARRIRRLLGAALSVLLSWSAAGAAVSPPPAPAGCCCKDHQADCRCAACEHAREIASGEAHLRSCGSGAPEALRLALLEPFLIAARTAIAHPRPQRPAERILPEAPDAVLEVPTPPPLA